METQFGKMRIIARERFDGHPHSDAVFLDQALKWFESSDITTGFVLMRLPQRWTAVFHRNMEDKTQHPLFGHGDSALEAVTNLLWEMRGHA